MALPADGAPGLKHEREDSGRARKARRIQVLFASFTPGGGRPALRKGYLQVVAAAVALSLAAVTFLLPPPAAEGAPGAVRKALEYLRSRQMPDGGFAEPGQSSSDQLTAWVVLAIASAGENPASWRKPGGTPIDYLRTHAAGWNKLLDIEKACLALSSAGEDPRSFAGRNLVAEIASSIQGDGHIGRMVNEHIWGIIALRAAGETPPDTSRAWLAARQNIDGGFGFSPGGPSDPDDTGAAIQALLAAGEDPGGPVVQRALEYLRFCQNADGGFFWKTTASNSASTSWAIQGIAAAGQDPASAAWSKTGGSPLDYLSSMQQRDGHVRYMAGSDSQPAWMTAMAIPALLKRPFPLNLRASAPENVVAPAPASPAAASPSTAESRPAAGDTAEGESGHVEEGGDYPAGGENAGVEVETGNREERAGVSGGADEDGGYEVAEARAQDSSGSAGGGHGMAVFLVLCAGLLVLLVTAPLGIRWVIRRWR